MWIRQCDLDAQRDDALPIPARIASNEEFVPPPQSPQQRQYQERALEIADRGIGIHPKVIPHVTKKFFRARNVSTGGAGIGLAIANRIASDHGGRIEIASAMDVGTTVTVRLPIAAMQSGSPA